MLSKKLLPLCFLLFLPAGVVHGQKEGKEAEKKDELTLELLFKQKGGMFGPSASGMAFSHDGKYAAYLYKNYAERRQGNDLWLWETATGKSTRITSIAIMAKYQASSRKAKDAPPGSVGGGGKGFGKGGKGGGKGKKDDKDGKKDDKKDNKDGEDKGARYSGVSLFTWSPNASELLFTSEGDIYRWKVGDKEPERLTMTRTPAQNVKYLPDGKGFTYLRNRELLRVKFGSHLLEQIDPKLPASEIMVRYRISPDGKRLAFITQKGDPLKKDGKKVNIASYRERFMKVNEVPRLVSDDPQPATELFVYLYDLGERMIENGAVSPIFSHKYTGPRDLLSSTEWSPDSRQVTFAVFEQASKQVKVLLAEVAAQPKDAKKKSTAKAKPARVVHKFLHHGGPFTPAMIQPHFLADNRHLVLLTEQSGFRHLHVLDPLYETIDQATFGKFEVYPLALSKDHKSFYVAATKEHPSCTDLYQVILAERKMVRLTKECGTYENAVVSPDGKTILANYERFGSPRELVSINAVDGQQKALTDSHPEKVKKLASVRPEFFVYKNRHGHDIHGFLFKPKDWSKEDKRPLLIYVYGGPLGTRKQVAEGSYNAASYFFARYMAEKHGYVTCTIDPRGGSGYGSAFEKANYEQPGKPQVEDLVDGTRFLVKNYGVDPKKIAIHGWSFGGFQTQMCLYTEPDVFAAGIAGAGPTEWENYNSWYSTGAIGPSRLGQPDLSKFSLLPMAKNLKSKLLLVHGMEDSNVLYQDTVRVYRELLKAGKETLVELFLDPTGGHGLGGDIDTLKRYRKYEEFLVRCLGNGAPAEAVSAKR
jgi:dipeptidyl aminopeptidase/acylaminoacyl peptidase